MQKGRVIGTVVCTIKVSGLEGSKFLLIQPMVHQKEENLSSSVLVACDQSQAGAGDLVFYVTSREASHVMPDPFVPVDAAVLGIVDEVQEIL